MCNNHCNKFPLKVHKAKQKALAVSHWCPQFSVLKELTQHFTVLSNHVSEKLKLKAIERNKVFQHIMVSCYTRFEHFKPSLEVSIFK